MNSHGDQPVSIAIVSGLPDTLACLGEQLDLATLENLSRLCEAYVFHDEILYIAYDVISAVQPLADQLDGITLTYRYDFHAQEGEKLCPLLRPFATPTLEADREDFERFARVLRRPPSSLAKSPTPLPEKPRDPDQWVALEDASNSEFARVELRVSAQLGATYYPTPAGTEVTAEAVHRDENAAIAIARRFAKLREEQLRELSSIIGRRAFPLQPPLVLAYAAASAETVDGLIATLRDLRNDGRLTRLRTYAASLAELSSADLISAAKEVDRELRRILDPNWQVAPNFADALFSIADISSEGLLKSLLRAGPRIVERLGTRRHLALLSQLHRVVPDAEHFYADLNRVFGPVNFSLPTLVEWLRNPRIADRLVSSSDYNPLSPTLCGSIAELNRLIAEKDVGR